MEDGEAIDIIDFIKARSHEIEAIEKSLSISHKKSLLWQRMPFYQRRRNRNYDKRKNKVSKKRKLDRHFLRTHSFYAKRYEMLKLDMFSIPYSSRLKNSKYIYKSQERGYIFDESFRGVKIFKVNEISDKLKKKYYNYFDSNKNGIIQYINNEYEIIIDMDTVVVIGDMNSSDSLDKYDCAISILKKYNYEFNELKDFDCKIYKNLLRKDFNNCNSIKLSEKLESHKIICKRSDIMNIYQKLIVSGFIPIGLKDIERLSLENDTLTIYDNVNSKLYKLLEAAINKEIISKYNRTPSAKKQAFDLNNLYLDGSNISTYFIFKCIKGACNSKAEIYCENKCIGRVIRAAYKFSSGNVYGLGFLTNISLSTDLEKNEFYCKNLTQKNFYKIEVIKWFDFFSDNC